MDKLDENGLRNRIVSLISEFAEKSRWEAVKLHQALKHVEKDTANHYTKLMEKQKSELTAFFEREVNAKENVVRMEMTRIINELRDFQEFRVKDALRAQEDQLRHTLSNEKKTFENELREELAAETTMEKAMLAQQHLNEIVALKKSIEDVRMEVSVFHNVASDIVNSKKHSSRIHEESAAVLALESKLSTSAAAQKEIEAFKKISTADSVIVSLLDAIPTSARTQGVPTLADLRVRFVVVKEEARKAALAPQNVPKMVGQIIGSALAALSWEAQGNVEGNSPEAILTRVSFYLDQGKLTSAIAEINQLSGYPRIIVQDWETAARNRVVTDNAINGLKAAVSLNHLELK